MAGDCCKLAGNLVLGISGCVISVSVNSKIEILKECGGALLVGPTTGTISLSAYASNILHTGCPGRAGVSIPWMKRYDCDTNTVYFINSGEGSSYIAGDINSLASLSITSGRSYPIINASSASGPSSVYMETNQEDGSGLVYTGKPISFDTKSSLIFSNFGVGSGDLYLQNFSLELNPGELPTCSYSFVFIVSD